VVQIGGVHVVDDVALELERSQKLTDAGHGETMPRSERARYPAFAGSSRCGGEWRELR
jgi:hypothetical protein